MRVRVECIRRIAGRITLRSTGNAFTAQASYPPSHLVSDDVQFMRYQLRADVLCATF